MCREWRLLRDGITGAHHHFAVEEALVRQVDEGYSPPTLRLRQVRRAVFVGIYQDTWREVDVDYCRAHGIDIVRRGNAGGAVYHDVGSFCTSAFFPRTFFPHEKQLYHAFARPFIHTCADYGVEAHFRGRNDLLVGERKIYGSAHINWYDTLVHSGTYLVNMDFGVMDRALTPPALKFAGKPGGSIRERVTSLARELGREVEVDEVMARLVDHFARLFDVEFVPGDLTAGERELAAELLATKYGTDGWNLGTRRAWGVTVSARAAEGVISLSADVEDGQFRAVCVEGDFLLGDRTVLERLERALAGRPLEGAQAVVREGELPAGIRDTLLGLLAQVAREHGMMHSAVTRREEE